MLFVDEFCGILVYIKFGADVTSQYIEVKGVKIPVFNTKLSEALNELTETQRTILLQNVILKIPLNQIADELGISTRMTEKHKHNAIMFLKRRLIHHE